MTPSRYTIEPDAAGESLRLTLRGDWDVATTEAFMRDVVSALRRMMMEGARPGHILTLVDMREKNILPREVGSEIAGLVRPDSPSKRIALVVVGALHRMQARRLVTDPRCAVFDDPDEAAVWLATDASHPRECAVPQG